MSNSTLKTQFGWWIESKPPARRALVAASLGWMLDSFDVMLYALVLASLIRDFGLSKQTAGLLGSIALIAAAVGGIVFGVIADRYGRTKALIGSVLIYAVFTAACGLAQNLTQLVLFRVLLGFGMGGEWASGAALVSETWPDEHRGKALGVMQSSWAIGYALAALVTGIVLPWKGWRAVFLVGILPAFFTLFIRKGVEESAAWKRSDMERSGDLFAGFREIFSPELRSVTIAVTLMNACTLFAWWGFNLWVPAYLSLSRELGGVGLSTRSMSIMIIVMQGGMWLGYVSFGFLSDRFGRKRCYVSYLLVAAFLLLIYSRVRSPWVLLLLGPLVAFFGTGYFTGFAIVTAELYKTRVRATAQGFTYNVGRITSAAAPFLIGALAQKRGFGVSFGITSAAFVLASLCWWWIPETKGSTIS